MNLTTFLEEIETLKDQLSIPAQEFLVELKEHQAEIGRPEFTENGIKIIKCMQEYNERYMNIFKSKELGELLFMAPRSVSGSMRKLISSGYAEKVGTNPVSYGLTEAGKKLEFDNN